MRTLSPSFSVRIPQCGMFAVSHAVPIKRCVMSPRCRVISRKLTQHTLRHRRPILQRGSRLALMTQRPRGRSNQCPIGNLHVNRVARSPQRAKGVRFNMSRQSNHGATYNSENTVPFKSKVYTRIIGLSGDLNAPAEIPTSTRANSRALFAIPFSPRVDIFAPTLLSSFDLFVRAT